MRASRAFIALILLWLCSRNTLIAQKTGIYLTPADFDNGHLTFTKQENLKYKFRLNELLHSKYIKITIGDSIFNLCKDSIFGYQDAEQISYRIYDREIYRIINPGETILLYSTTTMVNCKGNQTVTNYFFSAGSGSPVYALTKLNLKRAFTNDFTFHELIDMYFNNDADLLSYDSFYGIYKINRIHNLKWQ